MFQTDNTCHRSEKRDQNGLCCRRAKNADGLTDTYWGADARYAGSDFKIEAEYMTKNMNDREPGALNAAYIQGMYKIKVNNPCKNTVFGI